jgi:MoxR-like ATPase
MAQNSTNSENENKLEAGTYEIIRSRLEEQSASLRERLSKLNDARKAVFGSIETKLLTTERVSTENNCLARDIIALGDNRFLFGYNVHMGLKSETNVEDVFGVYRFDSANQSFHKEPDTILQDETFLLDFANLYKYYRDTSFTKFARVNGDLFMIFQVGKTPDDIKTFKWSFDKKGKLVYKDNRSDHEYSFPAQHEFSWKKVVRDMHRNGEHPHVSIEDRLFVETVGGDLTIKVEDNTDSGQGIYSETVDDPDQTLDDAEMYYALIGNLIALKVKPYKEEAYRYFVYNDKIQQAVRVDALADSCVLLPDNQGIIFAKGYYIQTGEVKLFDNQLENMLFERRIVSPNGEDFIYVFFQKGTGLYALMPYNIISQTVSTPIICHGFSLFEDGELIFFKSEEEQKKHHLIQIWQTPFYSPNKTVEVEDKSYLYKIGNKEIVRAMAEMAELQKLINQEDSYGNLYVDLVKLSTGILDTYHWLGNGEAYEINQPLQAIKQASSSAIDEFEKVLRIKRNTSQQTEEITQAAQEVIRRAKRGTGKTIYEFIERLNQLRLAKGEVASLRDLRYVDVGLVEHFEKELTQVGDTVSDQTVRYLLKEEALDPYRDQVTNLTTAVNEVKKVVDANRLEEQVHTVSEDLEMLIEVVSNLKIEDATQTTKIIDSISSVYAKFNRIHAALKKQRKTLQKQEGEAVFNAQLKLINQGLTNYLDISDTPEKCEDYRNKLMIQVEELEGRFAEFDEFIKLLSEKREQVYSAFETKKVQLQEARNKRSLALYQSADRIISGIRKRLAGFKTQKEINAYYASDLMVDKVRSISKDLLAIDDSVKADDIQSQLKTAYEEASRQLKDKQELFAGGDDVIQLGRHAFNVNTQEVDVSLVQREDAFFYHITGTNFFEQVEDQALGADQATWKQSLVSENEYVYRAEYLAYTLYTAIQDGKNDLLPSLEELHQMPTDALVDFVQKHMALRYEEGYTKGVHDQDAALIFKQLLDFHFSIGLLRFDAKARVWAFIWWHHTLDEASRKAWQQQFENIRKIMQVFPESGSFQYTVEELTNDLGATTNTPDFVSLFSHQKAAEYLFELWTGKKAFSFSWESWHLVEQFQTHLRKGRNMRLFEDSIKTAEGDVYDRLELVKSWLNSFVDTQKQRPRLDELLEAATILLSGNQDSAASEHKILLSAALNGFSGDHARIKEDKLDLHYNRFMERLEKFQQEDVVHFQHFVQQKKELLTRAKNEMRLEAFKPRVMSSFVRNQLINEVYLPLIGDNLAKQMGAAGDKKRTDLMGMLLLISPPGYGKTTLMEYIANRLGLVFMKINGPAIGHSVTALDPAAAENSAAREELEKLNLAFEMGDNIMLYLDDIQHCNPEFLQKFISLCDAQRKVEGIYKGVSKTYDLRGKKVAVVMAGNPYTESGEKFRIPDMLANRADTYNLGDVIGGKSNAFALSYIENSLTSNELLAKLRGQSNKDVYTLIKMAETDETEGVSFEGNHSPEAIKDYVALLKKMLFVRDAILKVNALYIDSAGQADAYRTEPPFQLQGSYRNMNKLVEKLNPLMNDEELQTLLLSHYENESQTLTTGAEFNFLRFKELLGWLTEEEQSRKTEILTVFQRNQKRQGLGGNEMGMLLEQVEAISKGLQGIGEVLGKNKESD